MPLTLSLPWWFSGIRERRLKLEGKEGQKGSNWDGMFVPRLEGKKYQRWEKWSLVFLAL